MINKLITLFLLLLCIRGMAIGYDVTNKIGVKISSDNIAKLMVGLTVRI